MLQGDLSTMPLQDLLQWVDAARVPCGLSIVQQGVTTHLHIEDRTVRSISAPPEFMLPASTRGDAHRAALNMARATAEDRLVDLFLTPKGSFTLVNAVPPECRIDVQVALRVLVMEGLRHLDEWTRLQGVYPSDNALLVALPKPAPRELSIIQKAVMSCASAGLALADARLKLGLSRPALLRRVEELRAMGLLDVEGASAGVDPVSRLIGQASVLVAERQFEEAAIVFAGLLAADPTDTRVRRLLSDAEREHVAALYQELDVLSVPRVVEGPMRKLSRSDREVMDRVNGRWDVGSVVLGCPLREVETLKSLRKLVRLGVLELQRPADR